MVLEYRPPTSEWESTLRPTWAEISLDAIKHNVRGLAALARPAGIMAVVKADAYGHGAVMVALAALDAGASWLAVAALEEAVELRRAGIEAPILVISAATPAQAEAVARARVAAAVADLEAAEALAAAGRRLGRLAEAHLKVDTGMGRLGVTPDEAGAALAARIAALKGLSLTGVYTHFATADEKDKAFARLQASRFERFLELTAAAGLTFRWRHAANSAAIIDMPETRHNLVRAGIALYGHYPSPDVMKERVKLIPAMTWKTRLVLVKTVPPGTPIGYGRGHVTSATSLIGTIPVGYADGYRRALGGVGRVLVRGKSCPVLGRVCMDHVMIGLDAVPEAAVGDEVVLLGGSEAAGPRLEAAAPAVAAAASGPGPKAATGAAAGAGRAGATAPALPWIPAEELARACGTIAYEILSTVGRRVPRVFFEHGHPVAVQSILGLAPLGGGQL